MKNEIKFYEGKFKKSVKDYSQSNSLLLRLFYKLSMTQKRGRVFNRYIQDEPQRVLDIGCSGGSEIVKRKGNVIGVDLSLASLRNAKKIYGSVILADIKNLPFVDGAFEVIVSFDIVGHIIDRDKNQMLKEMARVLKKSGNTIHFIETKGNCKLLKFARSYPELYRKYFIEQDGHFGLESPSEVVKRFENFFELLAFGGLYWNIWPPEEYVKRFNTEYKQESVLIKILVSFGIITKLNYVVYGVFCAFLSFLYVFEPKKFNNSLLIYIYSTKR